METPGRPPTPTPPPRERKKSIVVVPSRVAVPEMLDGGEETEIAVQLMIPPDGGWGWVVLACAFVNFVITDGVIYTFGVLLPDLCTDLSQAEASIALISAIQITMCFLLSPVACAFINRYGFRVCNSIGVILSCLCLFGSYFSQSYVSIVVLYGICSGLGFSFVNMCNGLIVGFYFEKRRALASAIATSGSSLGIGVKYPVDSILVQRSGWRSIVLLNCGLMGLVYFLGMSYRPLVSLTVTKTEENQENPTRTVTILPSIANTRRKSDAFGNQEGFSPTGTERIFNAVGNINFPTAAAVFQEEVMDSSAPTATSANQAGPSRAGAASVTQIGKSKLTLTAMGEITPRQLNLVKSMISRGNIKESPQVNIEIDIKPQKKRNFCARLCHWRPHVSEIRPMYRDDAFFQGKVENLPEYHKSVLNVKDDQRTGLEYQMAVSRAVTVNDLKDKRGICNTAVRRVLATMMDFILIRKISFLLYCSSGFLAYLGVMVPYIFLASRNESYGIDKTHCNFFLSVVGIANVIGKLALSLLTTKIEVSKVYAASVMFAGVSTIVSPLCTNVIYQYGYSFVFGFCISVLPSMRSVLIVSLYGLEKLTNATGMVFVFIGLGNLISTPMAGIIKGKYGYDVAFYVSGAFIAIGGMFIIPVSIVARKEREREKIINKTDMSKSNLS